nr:carbohydrate binding family 9 domain-containing protein [FCB group bacterium]
MSKSYHCFLPTLLCLLTLAFSAEKRIYTTQKTAVPPKLDGVFNETCWNLVEWSGGFTQHSPDDGAAPSQETAFKILYDHRYLYIAYRAFDNEPDLISKRLSRRDHFEGDWVEINIDSYFDQRTAFSFTASVSGAKGDEFISEDGNSWDGNWDPIWDFEAVTDSLGWSAEVRIPLSQLRFGSKEEHVWGIQLTRRIFRLEERSTWQYTPRDETGWVSNFGELHGINGIKAQKQIEILPYMVTQLEDYKPETENPFAPGRELASKYGLDGKIGITSDMTLDLTINPDFGQVEADPSQVNLSAFETYFQEKRPFFIEGRNIFDYQVTSAAWGGDYSSDNLFYSRRIGRPPQWYPDPDSNHEDDTWEHIRIPDNTRILGAFKLSGKTKDGLSIGMLESMTAREFGEIDSLGQRQHPTVEPQTNYFVGRLQKDYDNGNTILGGILTTTNRFGIKDKPFDALLHRQAYTGGLDLFHRWMDNTYYISANAIFSQVNGSEEAILNTQLAPARYYQRPDICHVSVDSSRTSLSGHGGTLKFGKSSGRRIEYETGVTWRSPGLELNDMGYLQKADQINHWTWIGLRFREPRGIFNEIGLNFNESMHWDYAGKKVHNKMNINGHLNFKTLWNAS